jgi:hypothetical protein
VLPPEPPLTERAVDSTTRLDPPARVRFPPKRITTAEIRKRVRHVLAYVGKVQQEEVKRKERALLLGLNDVVLPPILKSERSEGEEEVPDDDIYAGDEPTASRLLEEITRDLISFQEMLGLGGIGNTPIPNAVAVFAVGDAEIPENTPLLDFEETNDNDFVRMGVGAEVEDEGIRDGDDAEFGLGDAGNDSDAARMNEDSRAPFLDVPMDQEEGRQGEDRLERIGTDQIVAADVDEMVDVYREGEVETVVIQPGEGDVIGIEETKVA